MTSQALRFTPEHLKRSNKNVRISESTNQALEHRNHHPMILQINFHYKLFF